MLEIFNRRMRVSFPDLSLDEAQNVERGWVSQEVKGLEIVTAQLHHALKYNYRSVVLDVAKAFAHSADMIKYLKYDYRESSLLDVESNCLEDDDWDSFFYGIRGTPRYGVLVKEGAVFDDVRRRRLVELLNRTAGCGKVWS